MRRCAILMLAILLAAPIASGCARSAAQMAATQPEEVDLNLLKRGTHRDKVIARLGAPESSEKHGELTADVYKFRQGYSGLNRTARVFTHSTLSIATLGLWEVAGTAIEGYARGTMVSIRVVYNTFDQLESYEILDGANAVEDELVAKAVQRPATEAPKPEPKFAATDVFEN
ncbi:MAG: hypothetical protein AAFR23_05435 [Pseudomonadota bacterium]